MRSFRAAEARLRYITPSGNVIVEIQSIRLSTGMSAMALYVHLTMGGKFRIEYDLNRSLTHCAINCSLKRINRMQKMSITRLGLDVLIKLKRTD